MVYPLFATGSSSMMELIALKIIRSDKMITFTMGLLITFIIGYFVIKGVLNMFKALFGGIAKLFKKGD